MKETKVYVDELPESCDKCPYHSKKLLFAENKDSIYKTDCRLGFAQNCNIKSIKAHNRELVKKVCEKIKYKLGSIEDILINLGNGKEDALNYFTHILNEIEKEFEK